MAAPVEKTTSVGPLVADECEPGLGRKAGYLREGRASSGGLGDSPGDLVEKAPFKQTQGR